MAEQQRTRRNRATTLSRNRRGVRRWACYAAAAFSIDRALDLLPPTIHDQPLWIALDRISAHCRFKDWRKQGKRFVRDGDWDLAHGRSYSDCPSTQQQLIDDLFVRRIPFRETQRYRQMRERIEAGQSERGCRNVEELERDYFGQLYAIYSAIRDHGYKTQDELAGQGMADGREMMVVLDRHGQPLLLAGKHRFAICKVLGVEAVPIQVVGVHRQWARAACDRFRRTPWHAVLAGIEALAEPAAERGATSGTAAVAAAGQPACSGVSEEQA